MSEIEIAVYGAYGHTARFVTAELRARGLTPILSGRDPEKLAALGPGTRTATVDDPDSLDRALAGAAAVINCAGPFGETAPALIEAALRAGIHYLDVTGETLVAMDTFDTYRDDPRTTGVVIAPVMAFYGALGDLLATAGLGEWPEADEISLAVALDSWHPTRGTLLAGARRAGRRLVYSGRQWQINPAEPAAPTGTWEFGEPFGTQEVLGEFSTTDVVTIPRHLRTQRISTYLNTAPLRDLAAADTEPSADQNFLVEVEIRRGEQRRRVSASGKDIYGFTAPIVVEAVERILAGRNLSTGVRTAGELFEAADFLRALPLAELRGVTETTPAASYAGDR